MRGANVTEPELMNFLVYQAHSSPDIYHETIYSIYSYSIVDGGAGTEFIIFTDNIAYFKQYLGNLQVHYVPITTQLVTEWKGDLDFIHRVKIKVLQQALNSFRGNFLYVDSDTYFLRSLSATFQAISEGKLFMHCHEKNLDTSKVYRPLLNHKFISNGRTIVLTDKIEIWNAGAIGFTNDAERLLQEVLDMTDLLYRYYQKHVIEQFSFSYIFQSQAKINSLEKEIYHYWSLKEIRPYLQQIFDSPLSKSQPSLAKIVSNIKPWELMDVKRRWKKKGIARLWQQLRGQKFSLGQIPDLTQLIKSDSLL
jgi:hypothetical protein